MCRFSKCYASLIQKCQRQDLLIFDGPVNLLDYACGTLQRDVIVLPLVVANNGERPSGRAVAALRLPQQTTFEPPFLGLFR
jgi:hypothetical protein